MFSPEDFSVLAVYLACVIIGLSFSCLRFDVAIPIASDSLEAKKLLFLSWISLIFFSFLIIIILFLLQPQFSLFETIAESTSLIFLIPAGIGIGGIFSAYQYWAVRNENYSLIGCVRASQAAICVVTQLMAGILGSSWLDSWAYFNASLRLCFFLFGYLFHGVLRVSFSTLM